MLSSKGKLFERFVNEILTRVGFKEVKPDNKIIYNGPSGKMIHGLGQPHNADVLVEPDFQTPFYFQTRLLIECKDLSKKVGLGIIRDAVGLREDINHFDFLDDELLKERRNSKRKISALKKFDRFLYQVAVASSSGFTLPAQEFAEVHRIKLITFENFPKFSKLIKLMKKIDKYDNNDIVKWLALERMFNSENNSDKMPLNVYMERINLMVTNDGIMVFLYKKSENISNNLKNDEYELYFEINQQNKWILKTKDVIYSFDLPDIYQNILQERLENNENYKMIDLKIDYLGSLTIYRYNQKPKILTLSTNFIDKHKSQSALNIMNRI